MSFTGILIGTGILWGITVLIIQPIVGHLLVRKLQEKPEYAPLLEKKDEEIELNEDQQSYVNSLATKLFIAVDTAILGIAGLLIGVFSGYYFIGFSWEAKSWPGMIAFIASSFYGALLYAGA